MAVNEHGKKGRVRSVGMQATGYGEVEDIESGTWEKLDFRGLCLICISLWTLSYGHTKSHARTFSREIMWFNV